MDIDPVQAGKVREAEAALVEHGFVQSDDRWTGLLTVLGTALRVSVTIPAECRKYELTEVACSVGFPMLSAMGSSV